MALVLTAVVALAPTAPATATTNDPPRVLVIAAHPDDETLFNLGRFSERGWPTAVALVTNGEGGAVVQSIRPDYDPARDPDVLIEKLPGPDAWLTTPPDGPRLRTIGSPTALARGTPPGVPGRVWPIHRVQHVYLAVAPAIASLRGQLGQRRSQLEEARPAPRPGRDRHGSSSPISSSPSTRVRPGRTRSTWASAGWSASGVTPETSATWPPSTDCANTPGTSSR